MKNNLKISISSLILLTACGGGGSIVGGSSLPNINLPIEISDEIKNSNKQVTSLASAIMISNPETSKVRFANNTTKNEYAYIDDVELISYEEGSLIKAKFDVDKNGKIIAFSLPDEQLSFERDGDSNTFKSLRKSEGGSHYIEEEGKFISKGIELDLTYSDFGILDSKTVEFEYDNEGNKVQCYNGICSTNLEAEEFSVGFFGGYDQRKIDTTKIETDKIAFTGKALGYVSGTGFSTTENRMIETTRKLDGNATLTFQRNNGNPISTLNMKFDNWYDVTAIQESNDIVNLKFDNPKGESSGNNAFLYKLNTDSEYKDILHPNSENIIKDRDGNIINNNFSINYYYEPTTQKVIEAVGGINFIDTNKKDDYKLENSPSADDYNLQFQGAFGAKRNN